MSMVFIEFRNSIDSIEVYNSLRFLRVCFYSHDSFAKFCSNFISQGGENAFIFKFMHGNAFKMRTLSLRLHVSDSNNF